MKTLANCKPTEFFAQTNKIRKAVKNWLDVTEILEIRKRVPTLATPTKAESKEELEANIEKRKKAFAEQSRQNLFDILEVILDKHPQETIGLMALVCFIDPADADNHTMSEYLTAINELMGDKAVIDFFYSLASLGTASTSSIALA